VAEAAGPLAPPGDSLDSLWDLHEERLVAGPKLDHAAIATAFVLIAVGFIFQIDLWFTFNTTRLTLTPDFVTFILFAVAWTRLHRIRPAPWVYPLIIAMAVWHGFVFILQLSGLWLQAFQWSQIFTTGIMAAIVWALCDTIRSYARLQGDEKTVRMAHTRRVLYLVYSALIMLYSITVAPLLVPMPQMPLMFLILPLGLAGIVMLFLMIHLAIRSYNLASAQTKRGRPVPAPLPGPPAAAEQGPTTRSYMGRR
jgi:hypothetical protein